MADALPDLFSCTIRRMRGSRFAQSRTMASVLSVQPLATTTISVNVTFFTRCEANAASSRPILASSLWAIIPIEHVIGIGASAAVKGATKIGACSECCPAALQQLGQQARGLTSLGLWPQAAGLTLLPEKFPSIKAEKTRRFVRLSLICNLLSHSSCHRA